MDWRDSEASRVSASTVNHGIKMLRVFFGAAKNEGLIADNPAEAVGILKKSEASKRSGRRARHAQRAAKPVFDPCPPGQKGGAFKPLTPLEIEQIYDTALRLLETLGMGNVPDRLAADLRAADPFRQGGGRPFSKADRSRFLDTLDRVLR